MSWAEIWEFSKSQRDIIDAITISKIIVFEIICNVAYLCQGHPVSLWCWPLTCNLKKFYLLKSSFGMYNLERQLWYWHLLMRHCPCYLPTSPMNMERNFEATLWYHRWRHHHKKNLWHNLGRSIHIWGQIEVVFNIKKIQNGRHFELATNILPKVIPEVEYTREIAMSISDILSFWSTL